MYVADQSEYQLQYNQMSWQKSSEYYPNPYGNPGNPSNSNCVSTIVPVAYIVPVIYIGPQSSMQHGTTVHYCQPLLLRTSNNYCQQLQLPHPLQPVPAITSSTPTPVSPTQPSPPPPPPTQSYFKYSRVLSLLLDYPTGIRVDEFYQRYRDKYRIDLFDCFNLNPHASDVDDDPNQRLFSTLFRRQVKIIQPGVKPLIILTLAARLSHVKPSKVHYKLRETDSFLFQLLAIIMQFHDGIFIHRLESVFMEIYSDQFTFQRELKKYNEEIEFFLTQMEQLSVYQSRVFPDLKCVSVKSHVVRNEMRRGRVGQYFDTKCISASQQTKRIVQMLKALRQFDKLDIPPREFGPIYQWYYGDLMLPIDADYKRRLQDKIQSKPSQCPTKSQIRNFENPSSIGSGSSLLRVA